MTEAARMARSGNLTIKEMAHLEQQVRGYYLLHQREREQIQELRTELAHRSMQPDSLDTAADRIWTDLLHNRDVPPIRRRHSIESLVWGREILAISSAAYQIISQILPLPSDHLLRSKFLDEKTRVRNAVLDLTQLDELLPIWRAANTMGSEDRIQAILVVNAIAFKSLITIREDGPVKGIDGFEPLELPDLFSQVPSHPRFFQDFVLMHWHEVYSALLFSTFN
jgi:hypothetical protein